jgi:hypothetical protein
MPRPPDAFAFKPELTPQANVEAFLEQLGEIDRAFARLLRDNLGELLAATDRERAEARRRFNQAIADALDAPPDVLEGGS